VARDEVAAPLDELAKLPGSTSQCPFLKRGQRGWNEHALGGSIGLGTSPSSKTRNRRFEGSAIGIALMSARVYG